LDYLQSLQGRNVTVIYNGTVYTGKLVGASEHEVHLQTMNDLMTLPMADITDIRVEQGGGF